MAYLFYFQGGMGFIGVEVVGLPAGEWVIAARRYSIGENGSSLPGWGKVQKGVAGDPDGLIMILGDGGSVRGVME